MLGRDRDHDPQVLEQAAEAWLRELADTSVDAPHPLPDPALIWWKAQLLRRWQAERAASAPIERMRWIELAAGLASLVAFLSWQWQGLVNLVSRAIPMGLAAASAAASAPQGGSPTTLLLITGAMASIGALVLTALHRRLSGAC